MQTRHIFIAALLVLSPTAYAAGTDLAAMVGLGSASGTSDLASGNSYTRSDPMQDWSTRDSNLSSEPLPSGSEGGDRLPRQRMTARDDAAGANAATSDPAPAKPSNHRWQSLVPGAIK